LPLGAPGESPPCIRHRPFGIAGARDISRRREMEATYLPGVLGAHARGLSITFCSREAGCLQSFYRAREWMQAIETAIGMFLVKHSAGSAVQERTGAQLGRTRN
jgi:hypothetical protein